MEDCSGNGLFPPKEKMCENVALTLTHLCGGWDIAQHIQDAKVHTCDEKGCLEQHP